ncbi:M23 peptidase domain-containing protein, partial [Streptomyces sp. SPB074]
RPPHRGGPACPAVPAACPAAPAASARTGPAQAAHRSRTPHRPRVPQPAHSVLSGARARGGRVPRTRYLMGVPEPSPSRPLRRRRLLRYGAALTATCALAGYLVVRFGPDARQARTGCEVVSADGTKATYFFGADQAVNAATIAAVGTSRGMPERAVTIALATALQESGLRNLDHGDRDSVGLFQQRPSQGWGSVAQIMDPVYSAGKFYQRLAKVDGYADLPLTVAAQKVQRSAFPDAYAKHEPDAALLAAALTGRAAASLTCEATVPDGPGDPS